ncbi:unnamed protein product [Caenorhabditis brenneri]
MKLKPRFGLPLLPNWCKTSPSLPVFTLLDRSQSPGQKPTSWTKTNLLAKSRPPGQSPPSWTKANLCASLHPPYQSPTFVPVSTQRLERQEIARFARKAQLPAPVTTLSARHHPLAPVTTLSARHHPLAPNTNLSARHQP